MTSSYPPELKAQVIADFAMGMSKSALAKKYSVPRTTVIDWITTTEPPVPTVTDSAQRDVLGQLVYDYLVTGFQALIAQNRLAGDAAFLGRDGAPIVSLYNAIHSGVVAVAQAIERGQQSDSADEAQPAQLAGGTG